MISLNKKIYCIYSQISINAIKDNLILQINVETKQNKNVDKDLLR